MATKEEILDYATNTPENTNRNVLNSMLNNYGGSDGGFFFVGENLDSIPTTLTASYNDIKAAYDDNKLVILKTEVHEDDNESYMILLLSSFGMSTKDGQTVYGAAFNAGSNSKTGLASLPDTPLVTGKI